MVFERVSLVLHAETPGGADVVGVQVGVVGRVKGHVHSRLSVNQDQVFEVWEKKRK